MFRYIHKCARSTYRTIHSLRQELLKAQGCAYSTSSPNFPGSEHHKPEWTNTPNFILPERGSGIPVYRVLGDDGAVIDGATNPQLSKDECMHMYETMVTLNVMDKILYEAQRHGRISFYMTNFGEEATQVGSAAALDAKDLIWGQYREAGVLMYRGFPLIQFMHQCYGNRKDIGKGRQMPVHYGAKDLHFVTISSTLGTQMPQAVGSAYSYKMQGNGQCVVCFFGDGAASEGDAHGALNFAATLECPIVFICRNNGYAISTPTHEQYRGDGIASRGVGYGVATLRVNGNDIFAVYNGVKEAREMAVRENRPVLVEAMTYRIGHHSTSDDSSAYRSLDEISYWEQEGNPTKKLEAYLIQQGYWTSEQTEQMLKSKRKEVLTAFAEAENEKIGPMTEAYNDVYDVLPQRIQRQLEETKEHFRKYKDKYSNLDKFES